MRYILCFCIILLCLSLPVTVYAAADLVITCPATGDSCELTPEVSLFTETNLYPGYVQDPAQKVTFVNERTDQCHLKMIVENVSGDHLLNQVVGIKAFSDTKTFINSTLDQLMLYHHTISIVPPQTAQTYSWLTWIDPAAGNEFQNLTTQFDQVYHFTCAPPPTPTPTPTATLSPTPTLTPTVTPTPTQTNTPTPTSTNIPILTPHIGNTSTSTTPTPSILSTPEILPTTTQSLSTQESGEILCNDVAPDKPGSFFVRPNRGGGSAILTWTSPQSPHTGYQIVMGSEPSQLIYRSIDVGKINTYTVKSLTPGAQYCFYVQTTNGCALSSRTQTDCINVGSPVIAIQKPSEEFKENVLGAIDTTGSQMGQVLGATTNTCRLTNSSILFFIAALLGLVLYLLFHKTIHIGAHILISVFLSSLVMVLTVYFYQICRSHHMIVYYLSCVVPIGIMFIHTALKDRYEKGAISKKS